MKYRNWSSWMLAALVTPVFAGCSQGAEEPTDRIGQTVETAAESSAPNARRGFKADPAKLLERLDKNKDGALEASELPEHKGRHLLGADADKDGKITAAELSAHGERKHREHFARQDVNKDGFLAADEVGERWSRLSAADADKDGRVSFEEMQKAKADGTLAMGRGHRRGFPHKDPAQWLGRLDANKDGKLELSELPEHKRDKFGSADTNGDKVLSADELKALFAAKRKRAPQAPPAGGTTL